MEWPPYCIVLIVLYSTKTKTIGLVAHMLSSHAQASGLYGTKTKTVGLVAHMLSSHAHAQASDPEVSMPTNYHNHNSLTCPPMAHLLSFCKSFPHSVCSFDVRSFPPSLYVFLVFLLVCSQPIFRHSNKPLECWCLLLPSQVVTH